PMLSPAGPPPELRVPVREVALPGGEPPVILYDTSGPYTDPDAHTDIKRGLPPLRLPWVLGRADVEQLPGPTSKYRPQRDDDPTLGGGRFVSVRQPLRARPGNGVTPGHSAHRWAVPPVSHRSAAGPAPPRWTPCACGRGSRRLSCAMSSRAAGRSFRRTSIPRKASR